MRRRRSPFLPGLLSALLILAAGACSERTPTSPVDPDAPDPTASPDVLPATTEVCGDATEVDLVAGRDLAVGTVTVANDEDDLYVTYLVEEGWTLRETHLEVATSLNDVPVTASGNPTPGLFSHVASHDDLSAFTYRIARSDLAAGPGDEVIVAAHAEVYHPATDREEGAWGDGARFTTGGSWATHFAYELQRCPPTAVISSPGEGATGQVGDPIVFDGSASTDPQEGELIYSWDFGDGSRGGSAVLAHMFSEAGTYEVTLTVTNDAGLSGTASRTVSISAPPPPTETAVVLGSVRAPDDSPLSGVAVGSDRSGVEGTTDAEGSVRIEDVPVGVPVTFRLSLEGYADRIVRLDMVEGTEEGFFQATMRRRNPSSSLDAGEGGEITGEDGAGLALPPGGLIDASGNPVTGDVQVSLTPVDVSGAEIGVFPGDFAGVSVSGDENILVSFGAVEISVTREGESLDLAPGAVATIHIPVYTSGASADDEIELWTLDEASGVWIQEGTGIVVPSSGSPTGLALEATVGHLSWWNVDKFPESSADGTVRCRVSDSGDTHCGIVGRTTDEGPQFEARDVVPPESRTFTFPGDRTVLVDATGFGCTGSREVAVPASGSFDLPVDLTCADGTDATRISYGDRVSGEIATAGQVDAYVFAGEDGDRVRIDLSSEFSLTGRYRLLDPGGSVVDEGGFGVVEEHVFATLSADGDHRLEIASRTDDTGTYELGLVRFVQEAPVEITYGQRLTAEIGFPAEVDRFTFTGTAGDPALLRVEAATSGLAGNVKLLTDGGDELDVEPYGSTDGPAAIAATLPSTGTFRIRVDASSGVPGDFRLALDRTDGTPTAIAYGDEVSGTVDPAGEVDRYAFTGAAGDEIRLDLAAEGFAGFFTLRDPSGAVVASGDFDDRHEFAVLATSGTHHVSVLGASSSTTGSYSLGLAVFSGGTSATIDFGETVTDGIGFPSETDSYLFSGAVGDEVTVSVEVPAGSDLNGTLEIRNPSGGVFFSGGFSRGAAAAHTFELASDGSYRIQVSGVSGMPGTYELTLKLTLPDALPTGEILDEAIDPAGEVDEFTFDGTAGEVRRFFVGRAWQSDLVGAVTATAPSGAQVELGPFSRTTAFFDADRSVARVATLPEDGPYTLRVDGQSGEPGGYRIGVGTDAGRVDPTFGEFSSGFTRTSTPVLAALVLPDDDGIVAATSGGKVHRFDASGLPVAGFGSSGVVDLSSLSPAVFGRELAIQPDGKLLVAGHDENLDMAIARLNADGSLDTTFGTGGVVRLAVSGVSFSSNARVAGLLVLGDGDIFVVAWGRFFTGSLTEYPILARLNTDGSPDASFGTSGTKVLDGNGRFAPNDAALTSGGSIATAGFSGSGSRVALFLPDGTWDDSFGTGGLSVEIIDAEFRSVSVLPDGRILAGGSTQGARSTSVDFLAAMYTATGSLDAGFGSSGRTRIDLGYEDRANDALVADDGSVTLVGGLEIESSTTGSTSAVHVALVRLTTDGFQDPDFGIGGLVIDGIADGCGAADLQSAGDLVAGCDLGVVRFTP